MQNMFDTLTTGGFPMLPWGVVVSACLIAGITDIQARRIPNLLTGPLILTGFIFAGVVGGVPGLLSSLAAFVMLGLPYVLLFAFAGGGAGDAKLMMGVGAWLGLAHGTAALMGVCLTGIVLALIYAKMKNNLPMAMTNVRVAARGFLNPLFGTASFRDLASCLPDAETGQKMPYGVAIFTGVTLTAGVILLYSL